MHHITSSRGRTAFPTCLFLALALGGLGPAQAAPVSYEIDPTHTYPSFEADHMGLSYWRGKINKSRGQIVYDKATGSGTVEVQMELASIDFGLDAMNAWARGKDFFEVERHPVAEFKGRFQGVPQGAQAGTQSGVMPSQVVGELSLHGQTRPITLTLHQLKCIPHPLHKRELCGADASASFQRDEFGLSAGKDWGFKMEVKLRIQVEAVAKE